MPYSARRRRLFVGLLLALAAASLAALCVGAVQIPPLRVFAALGLPVSPAPPLSGFEISAVVDLRLPRVLLAILIGATLALSGAATQGLLRNSLADPGLIGVSAGAALAAALVIVVGLDHLLPLAIALPLASFVGGALAAWAVLRISLVDGRTRIAAMLLAGLAFNAVAGAGISFLSYVADDFALRSVTVWMFGSLGRGGYDELLIGLPLLLIPLLLIPLHARQLNALLLGETEAQHLGVDVEVLKRRLSLLIVLAVATGVALGGIIGFVGLIVPHLIRLWTGPDHRALLPCSAALGALLLVIADTAARSLFLPAEMPIGVLTALIGGPFFMLMLLRYGRSTALS